MKKNKILKYCFNGFFWFSILFYFIALFFGANQSFRNRTPHLLLMSRDVIYVFFLFFVVSVLFKDGKWSKMGSGKYGQFLKFYLCAMAVYLFVCVTHFFFKSSLEILQHEIRNTIAYSGFLIFLPEIFETWKDVREFMKQFIYGGCLVGLLGIGTRIVGTVPLSWEGRIISSMGDPNNLAVLLSFTYLMLVCLRRELSRWIVFGGAAIVLVAIILTSSLTGFAVFICSLSVIAVVTKNWWRGIGVVLLIYLAFIFSLGTKAMNHVYQYKSMRDLFEYKNEDRYLIDKVSNVTRGGVTKLMFNVTIEIPNETRTIKIRKSQMGSFPFKYKKSAEFSPLVYFIGDINSHRYQRFDNQFFNLLTNMGLIGLFSIVALFVWTFIKGFKLWLKFREPIVLSLTVGLLSVFFLGFNGAAFLNRFPLNFILYLFIGLIFLSEDLIPPKPVPSQQLVA